MGVYNFYPLGKICTCTPFRQPLRGSRLLFPPRENTLVRKVEFASTISFERQILSLMRIRSATSAQLGCPYRARTYNLFFRRELRYPTCAKGQNMVDDVGIEPTYNNLEGCRVFRYANRLYQWYPQVESNDHHQYVTLLTYH